ncbi:hypothetical protein X727_15725 [Mesorhizobium sp. L103C119B0]|nr:hypothetical protein X727_15725 [Mesorhizobium sp. L103C119B0]
MTAAERIGTLMTETPDIAEAAPITPSDIVAIRNARNWKRSNLAAYLGCNYTTVWRMENGKIAIDGAHRRLLHQLKPAARKRSLLFAPATAR